MIDQIDAALARVPGWLDTLRRPGPPFGRYVYRASSPRPWCVYAALTGLQCEHMAGSMAQWTDAEHEEAFDQLLCHQDPTDGLFRCPICIEDASDPLQRCQDNLPYWSGVTKKAVAFLYDVGREPRHRIPLDGEAIPEDVEDWLEGLFAEKSPYGAGSRVGHLVGTRAIALRQAGHDPKDDLKIRRVHSWLFVHQEPSGFFHAGDDLENGMNGLLKMRYGVFEATDTAIPNPERAVETILSLQRPDGRFGASCGDFNGVTLLASCGRGLSQCRARILAAFERVLPAILAKQDATGGFTWNPDSDEEPMLTAANVNMKALLDIKEFAAQM